MSKSEMETLINETKTKIETIQDFIKEIESNKSTIESTKETLLNQLADLQLKKEEIENAYDIICVDNNE
jgi:predicted nuclease with TOPRIM domain